MEYLFRTRKGPPESRHVGDGRRAGVQARRRGRATLAVNGGVILERGRHGGFAFGEASEMCCEGAASGCIPCLLREL